VVTSTLVSAKKRAYVPGWELNEGIMRARELEQDIAARFGSLVPEQRITAKLRQADLAMAAGVGRRFIVDLEAGKPSCHLGRALKVAEILGLEFPNLPPPQPDLPDFSDEDEGGDILEDDGVRIHEWIRKHQ